MLGIMNDTDSDNMDVVSHREESARGLLNNINNRENYNMQEDNQEQESNKSD